MREMALRFFLGGIALLLPAASLRAQPAVYIVRHAEKISQWLGDDLDRFHPLSEAGMARAQRLAGLFEKGSVIAIYSSPTTRTLHTAQPLAHKLRLEVRVAEACWDTSAIAAFFAELQKRHQPGEAVLLVSHSNHIPHLLIKAGLPRECWQEMGIVVPDGAGELMIEGYDTIWKIGRLGGNKAGCGNFAKARF